MDSSTNPESKSTRMKDFDAWFVDPMDVYGIEDLQKVQARIWGALTPSHQFESPQKHRSIARTARHQKWVGRTAADQNLLFITNQHS